MGILKPRTASVILYQGDDLERLAELRREVTFAEHAAEQALRRAEAARTQASPSRLGDPDETEDEYAAAQAAQLEAEAAYDDFVTEAAERAVEIHLQAIGSLRFNALVGEHPPRVERDEKDRPHVIEADQEYAVNTTTFPRALLTFDDDGRRTIVGPDEVVEDPDFVDDVSAGQLELLFDAAYWLNRTRGVDPKATRFSITSQSPVEN